MTSRIVPVILCGGSGTRLWPLSRAGFPKQFLSLTGDESLFQQAARRIAGLEAADIEVSAPLIVSNEEHRFLASEQLRESGIEPGAFLLEPVGRNTAPALSLAALAALDQGSDPILVVTPADQTVADQPAFTAAMQTAIRAAESCAIVVLGISPDRPETGYGYIKAATGSNAVPPAPTFAVERFVEKPDTDNRSQDVKAIVNQLNSSGREEHTLHRKVHRPWGWYDSIDDGERFKVKRIQVKPKASLSLQKHHHRAEHWGVVKGTAEIVCGDKTILLTENQSTYIPLEIIEVQSGSYLGEDDIVRFEDNYGR